MGLYEREIDQSQQQIDELELPLLLGIYVAIVAIAMVYRLSYRMFEDRRQFPAV